MTMLYGQHPHQGCVWCCHTHSARIPLGQSSIVELLWLFFTMRPCSPQQSIQIVQGPVCCWLLQLLHCTASAANKDICHRVLWLGQVLSQHAEHKGSQWTHGLHSCSPLIGKWKSLPQGLSAAMKTCRVCRWAQASGNSPAAGRETLEESWTSGCPSSCGRIALTHTATPIASSFLANQQRSF